MSKPPFPDMKPVNCADYLRLVFVAQSPEENRLMVEDMEHDAQRIGDILIGRTIPITPKYPYYKAAADELIRLWRK